MSRCGVPRSATRWNFGGFYVLLPFGFVYHAGRRGCRVDRTLEIGDALCRCRQSTKISEN
jgi:hypothetical protein